MTAADDFYRIDGSKVWLSPTAREYAAQYFGPGRQGVRKMADYLRMIGSDSETTTSTEAQIPEAATGDFQADAPPSENIENRREEPVYGPGGWPNIFGTGSPQQTPFE